MLDPKDIKTLVNVPNDMFDPFSCVRVMLCGMPESILKFYEDNTEKIKAQVVVVRSNEDEWKAAKARNNSYSQPVLFVFGYHYTVTSYFSGVCRKMTLSKAFLNRIRSLEFES